VAFKLLAEHLSDDESFRARFRRESQLAAGLDHPNIVTVFAAGNDAGRHYIAMRYVRGPHLGDHVKQRGRLSATETIAILEQVAAALDAAHAQEMLHRDVKPENILLEADEEGHRAFLADLGIARMISPADSTPTTSLGTFVYCAPEVFGEGPVGVPADVYSLACVAYECLTGRQARTGATNAAVVHKHLAGTAVSARGSGPAADQEPQSRPRRRRRTPPRCWSTGCVRTKPSRSSGEDRSCSRW
jgi:serine/threonine-protein kinase